MTSSFNLVVVNLLFFVPGKVHATIERFT